MLTTAHLREVRLLQGFSEPELGLLLAAGEILSFEPHASIVIEGEPSGGLYFLLEGQAAIFKANRSSGGLHEIAQLQAGHSFGEMSLIDDAPRSATVQAMTACKCFHLPREAFVRFLARDAASRCAFYERCVAELAKRLRQLDDHYVVSQHQLWKVAVRGDGRKAS